MRNLFYDLPDELQRKIELMRPTHPVADLLEDFLWNRGSDEEYGVGGELTDALLTLRDRDTGLLLFPFTLEKKRAWEAEQKEERERERERDKQVDDWIDAHIWGDTSN